MKVVVSSDAQFNPWKEFSRILSTGRNSRLQDQLDAQDEIFKACTDVGAHILVHTGDLYETLTEKIDKATFLAVYNKFVEFSKSGVIVVLVIGNHDWLDRTETFHILEPFKEIKNVIVVDEPRVEIVDSVSFCFIPYTRIDFRDSINQVVKLSKDSRIKYLFTHQGVNGAKTGPRDMVLKDEYNVFDFKPDYFDVVFNGHYHKPQTLGKNFIIVGSMVQKDFGEREDVKGFWILDTEVKSLTFTRNKSSSRFFKIEVKDKEEFKLPKEFSNRDFLWLVTNRASVLELPEVKKLEMESRIRIDFEISRLRQKLRTDISISMSTEEQLVKYVAHTKTDLSRDLLTKMGVDKWKRSQ